MFSGVHCDRSTQWEVTRKFSSYVVAINMSNLLCGVLRNWLWVKEKVVKSHGDLWFPSNVVPTTLVWLFETYLLEKDCCLYGISIHSTFLLVVLKLLTLRHWESSESTVSCHFLAVSLSVTMSVLTHSGWERHDFLQNSVKPQWNTLSCNMLIKK